MINQTQDIQNQTHQNILTLNPDNDSDKAVWLISVKNRLMETKPGVMVGAKVGVIGRNGKPCGDTTASRCLAEETHVLADEDQIRTYLKSQDDAREARKKADAEKKVNMNVNVVGASDNTALLAEMAELKSQIAALMAVKADPVKEDAKPEAKGKK